MKHTAHQHTRIMLLIEAGMNFAMAFGALVWPRGFDVFTFQSSPMDITLGVCWIAVGLLCFAALRWMRLARTAIFLSTIPLLFVLGLVMAETYVRVTDYGPRAKYGDLNVAWVIPLLAAMIAQRWAALRFSRFAPKDCA